jgi:hypothetical protein
MSDTNYEFEDDVKDQVERNPVRAQIHRNKMRRIKELEGKLLEATEAQRKLAFVEAGVDINAPASRYFVKGYDGEMTADAIRQAAQEVRISLVLRNRNPKYKQNNKLWNQGVESEKSR